MSLHRILSTLLMTCLLTVAILPTNLAAQEACTGTALASHELALLQVHGQVFPDLDCTQACANDETDALASYGRALQAQDHVLLDVGCTDGCVADAIASYERALLQAHGQVMAGSARADCGIRA